MRGLKRSIDIPRPIDQVWARLADLRNWGDLVDAFGWAKSGNHFIISGLNPIVGAPLNAGDEVLQKNSGERRVLAWKVTELAPPHRLALSAKQEGRLNGLNIQWTMELQSVSPAVTRVQAGFVVIFHNILLEIISFVLPLRWLYRRGVDRMLQKLNSGLLS